MALYNAKAIREAKAGLHDEAQAIFDIAQEEDRELTAEETARIDAIQGVGEKGKEGYKPGELDALDEKLLRAQKHEDRMAALAVERAGKVNPQSGGEGKPDDPKKDKPAAKIPANVKRVGSLKNFKGERGGLSAEQRAYNFGQWCLAKASTDLPNKYQFDSAKEYIRNAMGETDVGSPLVLPEFSTDLIDLREQYGVARQLLKVVPMNSDSKVVPRRVSGLTAYPVMEHGQKRTSEKAWNDVTLVAKTWAVLSVYSEELRDDAIISIADDLYGEIGYAFAQAEDDAAINGDGTSAYHGITGLIPKMTGKAGLTTQGTGNTWGQITLGDLYGMLAAVPDFGDTNSTRWLCHKSFYFSVMVPLMTAAGGTTPADIADASLRTFLGYPVMFSNKMPSSTGTGQVPLLFGDFALAGTFGDRQGEEIKFSEHATVDGKNVFEHDQIAIRGTERFDIVIHDIGDANSVGPVVGLQTGAA